MQDTDVKYLDGDFIIEESEPSALEELIAMIGEEACVENINSNLRYRNKYPRVYGLVSDAIASEHGFARAEKSRTAVEGKPDKVVMVSPMDHIRDFVSQDDANKATVEALFTAIAPVQPLYVKGERTGGGGKISQQALDTATEWFAAGPDTVNAKIGMIEGMVPGYKVARNSDGEATVESAARGIQTLQRFLVKKAQADAASALK